jgi:hypothetical protein
MIAESMHRVEDNTSPEINETIHRGTEININFYGQNRHLIPQRLRELDKEWDVERTLATLSTGFTLTGLAMSLLGKRKWLILPAAVQAFYMQHALQGWCPPLAILRKLGFRTVQEIDEERIALNELLGSQDGPMGGVEATRLNPEDNGSNFSDRDETEEPT